MAVTISIVCYKGGVGKTTTAASLGGILADKFRKKVLLVDMDAQTNLSSTFLDTDQTEGDVFDIFSVLDKKKTPDLPIENIRRRLDIIPASSRMCSLDMVYGAKPGREYPLKKALLSVKDAYDYVIVDSPAQIGVATSNAITAADYIVIPMSCDAYSLDGLNQIMELIDGIKEFLNPEVRIAGILKTKFQRRRVADSLVDEQLAAVFGDRMFSTSIRECAALVQAPLAKMDILTFDAKSNGAADYTAFAQELIRRIKKARQ